jgi:transposase InsO family protein
MTAVGGESHKVVGIGHVPVKFSNGAIKTIKNVLYVPGIRRNLFSVGCLIDDGCSVKFYRSKCQVKDRTTQSIVCVGTRLKKGLYKLDVETINTSSESYTLEHIEQELNKALLWHRRLGHLNFEALYQLSKNKAVKGLLRLARIQHIYEVCQEGKQAPIFFPKSITPSTDVLQLICSDVCGLFRTHSYTGARYFVSFIDDFSRKTWVYLLKSKDAVYDEFKKFKALVENYTGKKIQTLHTDNGGEYISKRFQELCEQAGIKHEKSQAYMPQSNGVSERMNRTLVETARCLCFQSNIPSNLWSEAIKMACFLINRRPTKKIHLHTPEEVFTGTQVDISNLRTFGTRIFVHVPKNQRDKLGKKSLSCTLLGIDEYTKGYQCYCPASKRILISRDVTIDERHIDDVPAGPETMNTFPYAEFKITIPDSLPPGKVYEPPISIPAHEIRPDVPDIPPCSPEPSPVIQALPNLLLPLSPASTSFPSRQIEPIMSSSLVQTQPRVYTRRQPHVLSAGLRRSTRSKRPSVLLDGFVGNLEADHLTFRQASKDPQWLPAMQDEIDSLKENKTWKLTELPPGKKAITSKWIFKLKPGQHGSDHRYKARQVARGFQQKQGIDFFETYAAIAKYNTIKTIAALMGTYGWEAHHFDIKTAFLNSSIQERVFMKQPQGWVVLGKLHIVCEL